MLVEDLENFADLTIREKSTTSLEFAHINIYIVTFNGIQDGLSTEIEHIIHNASRLSFKTIVFFEEKVEEGGRIRSLSQLQIDGLIEGNIRFYSFRKSERADLLKTIKTRVWAEYYHYTVPENRY
ncbi:MAG: hypothetical protein R6U96_11330 [Promethearchaeia archaeon]